MPIFTGCHLLTQYKLHESWRRRHPQGSASASSRSARGLAGPLTGSLDEQPEERAEKAWSVEIWNEHSLSCVHVDQRGMTRSPRGSAGLGGPCCVYGRLVRETVCCSRWSVGGHAQCALSSSYIQPIRGCRASCFRSVDDQRAPHHEADQSLANTSRHAEVIGRFEPGRRSDKKTRRAASGSPRAAGSD